MRGPMVKWQHAINACEHLLNVLRAQGAELLAGDTFRDAAAAVAAFREHVETAEECEEP